MGTTACEGGEAIEAGSEPNGRRDQLVLDAMSRGERLLTLVVLVLNLSFAAWLIQDADFSALKPRGETGAVAAGALDGSAARTGPIETDAILIAGDKATARR